MGAGTLDGCSVPRSPREVPWSTRSAGFADDLRISVTDRCNFRCTYCMPAEGLAWLPKTEILTFEELTRLLGCSWGSACGR